MRVEALETNIRAVKRISEVACGLTEYWYVWLTIKLNGPNTGFTLNNRNGLNSFSSIRIAVIHFRLHWGNFSVSFPINFIWKTKEFVVESLYLLKEYLLYYYYYDYYYSIVLRLITFLFYHMLFRIFNSLVSEMVFIVC